MRNAYKILVEKPEWNRSLQRQRRWWEGNIKTDLKENGCDDMDWIKLVHIRIKLLDLVKMETNHRVP